MNSKIDQLTCMMNEDGVSTSVSMVRVDRVWLAKMVVGDETLRAEGELFGIALERLDEAAGHFMNGCPICSAPQAGAPYCPHHGG